MNPDEALEVAQSIGELLVERAIVHEGRATWLGDEQHLLDGTWQVVHSSIEGDLYGGTSGVALYLGRLAAATGRDDFAETARQAFEHARRWYRQTSPPPTLYEGSLGLACVAAELADLLDGSPNDAADFVVDELLPTNSTEDADLVGGRAGSLVALLHLATRLRRPDLDPVVARLAASLAGDAERGTHRGASWRSTASIEPGIPPHATAPLCGLAHGASGVAWALAEYATATGDDTYRAVVRDAIEYERAWFDAAQQNWPDLRGMTSDRVASGERPSFPVFWCHGALGIGLVRLRLHQLDERNDDAAEAEAAIMCALRFAADVESAGMPYDLSLCHGLGGVVELLVYAAHVFDEPELRAQALTTLAVGLDLQGADDVRWPCGVRDGGENPSLMLGIAGIGLAFLRAADPRTQGMGLPYAQPMSWQRLIVKLAGEFDEASLHSRAHAIVAEIDGARLDRISRRGRILVRIPSDASISEITERLSALADVEYAEPDVTDRATD